MSLWKFLAEAEPNERLRSDYGGLALVFAEAAGCHEPWKKALEGWNVRQSQQVLEWQREARVEGRAEGKAEALLRLLELKFHTPVPVELATAIKSTTDLDQLSRWFDAAVTIGSLDAFRQLVQP
jgi:hypothetical protein